PSSCEVLLIAPPPMELGAGVSDPKALDESRRLACRYKNLAQKLGIRFADAGIWEVGLAFDGVHFSDMGHRAFAAGIQKTLKQIVSETD
ncbi:MAG: arylesterase, partial [Oscillospiraceae bacterium]|nr:arylesterase [Oscillospiraceae bacterium]